MSCPPGIDYEDENFIAEQRRIYQEIQKQNDPTQFMPQPAAIPTPDTPLHRLLRRVDYCPYSFTCMICYDEVDVGEFATKMGHHRGNYWGESVEQFIEECPGILLSCLHVFCTSCLAEYAHNYTLYHLGQQRRTTGDENNTAAMDTTAADTSPLGIASDSNTTASQYTIPCPDPGCTSVLSEHELRVILGNRYEMYEKKQLLLSLNPTHFHHCITPNCEYVVYWDGTGDVTPGQGQQQQQQFEDPTAPQTSRGLFIDLPTGTLTPSARFNCPQCLQSMCLRCRVPWHTSMTCQEYHQQKMTAAASSVSSSAVAGTSSSSSSSSTPHHNQTPTSAHLAKAKDVDYTKYRQCPSCQAMIEKVEGCDKMRCLCGYGFCFYCLTKDATCNCTPSNHVFYDNVNETPEFTRNVRGGPSSFHFVPAYRGPSSSSRPRGRPRQHGNKEECTII